MKETPCDTQARRCFTIAPSDLTFLLSECTRCFYLKVALGQRRTATPMPAVFTILDRQQRQFFEGKPTSELHPDLPPGIAHCGDLSVRSAPVVVPGHEIAVEIRGSLDAALVFDDATFGIVDLKTTEPKTGLASFYSPQLHAYALAVENPAFGRVLLKPVTLLGLLCFSPNEMIRLPDGGLAYRTTPTWIPIPRDDTSFFMLLGLVADLLERPSPPDPSPGCPWCRDRPAPPADPALATIPSASRGGLHPQPMFGLPW
jgi:hypothetical protein